MFDKLLTAALREGKQESLFRVQQHWLDAKEIVILDFIKDYIIEYDEMPDYEVVNARFTLDLPVKGGRFEHELKNIENRYIYTSLADKLPNVVRDLKSDPKKKLSELRDLITDLESTDGDKDSPHGKHTVERFERYKERIGKGGVTHLSMGHPVLDSLFYGWGKTDLVTLAARSGLGKTWFLLLLALLAEPVIPDEMGDILIFSMEMGADDLNERLDCMRFKLDYDLFLHGKLNRKETLRYKEGLKELEIKGSRIIIVDSIFTLQEVQNKILLYRPSLVMIDGSYMLEPDADEDWKKIVKITRNLKGTSRKLHIPIFNTTQMKRGTGTKKSKSSFDAQDDFSWGSSYIQDSDTSITAYQTPQMQYDHEIGMTIAKGRKIKPGTELTWYNNLITMEYDFSVASTTAPSYKPDEDEVKY